MSSGPFVPLDSRLVDMVAKARQFLAQKRYADFAQIIQETIDRRGEGFVEESAFRFTSARLKADDIIRHSPPQALEAYRMAADASAKALLGTAEAGQDESAWKTIRDRYFMSSLGDDASFELGCRHMDRHEFAAACRMFREILERHPDPSVSRGGILLRLAVARARLGDADGAKAALRELRHAGDAAPGDTWEVVAQDVAKALKERPAGACNGVSMPALAEGLASAQGGRWEDVWTVVPVPGPGRRNSSRRAGSMDPALFVDGCLYRSREGVLACLDGITGTVVWTTTGAVRRNRQSGLDDIDRLLSFANGTVYHIEDAGRAGGRAARLVGRAQPVRNAMCAYESRTGTLRWRVKTGDDTNAPLWATAFLSAPVPCAGHLVMPTVVPGGVGVVALDPDRGAVRWHTRLCKTTQNTLPRVSIAADGIDVFAATGDGVLVALDGHRGALLWAARYPRTFRTTAVSGRRTRRVGPPRGWNENTIHVSGDRILLFPADSENWFLFDRHDGRLLRKHAVEKGYVLLGSQGGRIHSWHRPDLLCVDVRSGARLWKMRVEDVAGRPACAGSAIIVARADSIDVIDGGTGRAIGSGETALSFGSPAGDLLCDGRKVFMMGGDRVSALADAAAWLAEGGPAAQGGADADMTATRGLLAARAGRHEKALGDLRAACALLPRGSPAIGTLRRRMLESILALVERDVPDAEALIGEGRGYARDAGQTVDVALVEAAWRTRRGDIDGAMDCCLRVADCPGKEMVPMRRLQEGLEAVPARIGMGLLIELCRTYPDRAAGRSDRLPAWVRERIGAAKEGDPAATGRADWPCRFGTPRHDGLMPDPPIAGGCEVPLTDAWSAPADPRAVVSKGTPGSEGRKTRSRAVEARGWRSGDDGVIVADRLYHRAPRDIVCRALDDGSVVWCRETMPPPTRRKRCENPAMHLTHAGSTLYYLEAHPDDGGAKRPPPGRPLPVPRNVLVATDPATGAPRWKRPDARDDGDDLKDVEFACAPLPCEGGLVIPAFGNTDLYLVALEAGTGRTVWRTALGENIKPDSRGRLAVAADGGEVYVLEEPCTVHALDGRDGARCWRARAAAASEPEASGSDPRKRAERHEHTVCLGNDILVALPGDGDGWVAFDRLTGRRLCASPLPGDRLLVAMDGVRLCVSGRHEVAAYDVRTGVLAWKAAFESITGRPAATAGSIYVPTPRSIVAVDRQSGGRVATIEVKPDTAIFPELAGRLLCTGSRVLSVGDSHMRSLVDSRKVLEGLSARVKRENGADALEERIGMYRRLGRTEDALRDMRALLARQAGDEAAERTRARLVRMLLAFAEEVPDRAPAVFEEAMKLAAGAGERTMVTLAMAARHAALGDIPRALDLYTGFLGDTDDVLVPMAPLDTGLRSTASAVGGGRIRELARRHAAVALPLLETRAASSLAAAAESKRTEDLTAVWRLYSSTAPGVEAARTAARLLSGGGDPVRAEILLRQLAYAPDKDARAAGMADLADLHERMGWMWQAAREGSAVRDDHGRASADPYAFVVPDPPWRAAWCASGSVLYAVDSGGIRFCGEGPAPAPSQFLEEHVLYYAGAEGMLVCARVSDGTRIWTVKRKWSGEAGAPARARFASDGQVLLWQWQGKLTALALTTGEILWEAEGVPDAAEGALPACVPAHGIVVVPSGGRSFRAFDMATGAVVWERYEGAEPGARRRKASPARMTSAGSYLYLDRGSGKIGTVDPVSGMILGAAPVSSLARVAGGGSNASPVACWTSSGIILPRKKSLVHLALPGGVSIWNAALPAPVYRVEPVSARMLAVWAGASRGRSSHCALLDAGDGTVVWKSAAGVPRAGYVAALVPSSDESRALVLERSGQTNRIIAYDVAGGDPKTLYSSRGDSREEMDILLRVFAEKAGTLAPVTRRIGVRERDKRGRRVSYVATKVVCHGKADGKAVPKMELAMPDRFRRGEMRLTACVRRHGILLKGEDGFAVFTHAGD